MESTNSQEKRWEAGFFEAVVVLLYAAGVDLAVNRILDLVGLQSINLGILTVLVFFVGFLMVAHAYGAAYRKGWNKKPLLRELVLLSLRMVIVLGVVVFVERWNEPKTMDGHWAIVWFLWALLNTFLAVPVAKS